MIKIYLNIFQNSGKFALHTIFESESHNLPCSAWMMIRHMNELVTCRVATSQMIANFSLK